MTRQEVLNMENKDYGRDFMFGELFGCIEQERIILFGKAGHITESEEKLLMRRPAHIVSKLYDAITKCRGELLSDKLQIIIGVIERHYAGVLADLGDEFTDRPLSNSPIFYPAGKSLGIESIYKNYASEIDIKMLELFNNGVGVSDIVERLKADEKRVEEVLIFHGCLPEMDESLIEVVEE